MLTAMVVLLVGFASATSVLHDRPCGAVDLCTWKTVSGAPLYLPLGSADNGAGCGLTYNTEWSLNTNSVATCVFDGSNLDNVMLYLSIDNDIISCTLNGKEVFGATNHENCAPADPRNGYSTSLSPVSGQNTLVCEVRDRGVMDHFDACVTGTPKVPTVPEFGLIAGLTTVLGALGVFFVVRRK